MTEEFSTIDIVRNNLYDGRTIFRKQIITKLLAEVDDIEQAAYRKGLERAVEEIKARKDGLLPHEAADPIMKSLIEALESELAKQPVEGKRDAAPELVGFTEIYKDALMNEVVGIGKDIVEVVRDWDDVAHDLGEEFFDAISRLQAFLAKADGKGEQGG